MTWDIPYINLIEKFGLIAVLAWFMFRMETKLKSLEEAIRELAKKI